MYLSVILSFLLISETTFEAYCAEMVLLDLGKLELLHEVDERFLSFTIDSKSLAHHWLRVGLRSKKVIALTRAMRPSYLRIGGTDGDNLIFEAKSNATYTTPEKTERQSYDKISASDIIQLGKFINETEAELIYGLNVLQRNDSRWDPTNSMKLIRFMSKHGIPVSGWELGNEPNRFRKVYNYTLGGKKLAEAFNRLKNLIQKFPRYSTSLIIGPDIGAIRSTGHSLKLLERFLQYLNPDILSRLTFHHYYFPGKNATVKSFLDAELMDTLKTTIAVVKEKAKPINLDSDIWIGETSCGYGGGTPNVSDRFVSNFLWLDKLGQSALGGIKVVFRQTLIASGQQKHPNRPRIYYSLIDPSHHPTPGYFVSYVFKKLTGKKVLSLKNALTSTFNSEAGDPFTNNRIRLYAHCSVSNDSEIIVYGMNVGDIYYNKKGHLYVSDVPAYYFLLA